MDAFPRWIGHEFSVMLFSNASWIAVMPRNFHCGPKCTDRQLPWLRARDERRACHDVLVASEEKQNPPTGERKKATLCDPTKRLQEKVQAQRHPLWIESAVEESIACLSSCPELSVGGGLPPVSQPTKTRENDGEGRKDS